MSRSEVFALYRERLSEREREKSLRKRKVAWVSYARLATFVAGVALLWFVWEREPEALGKWAEAPPLLTSEAARWAALVLGAATATLAVLWLASRVDRVAFLMSLAASASFALFFRSRTSAVLSAAEPASRDLSVLASLLDILESQSFAAEHLVSLQSRLSSEGEKASSRIRRLARLIEYLDARRNQLFAPVAALLLWATQIAFAIEAWRRSSGHRVPEWLEAVGELDVLLALASYGFENPEDVFPETSGEGALFEAEGLGHPLIPPDRLVRNDVILGRESKLLVVSGSNMSGKSTLLRSIGVATVLGLAGAPVRARRLTLTRLRVAASIRIEDSLQEGISHFYAEILRLRSFSTRSSTGRTPTIAASARKRWCAGSSSGAPSVS
jgi:hypothetical protein